MKHQQGATMIIVLVVLLLVAIAGTIALRSGVFGMRLSTNSQVAKLLSNNNDSALTKFEDMDAIDIQASFALGGAYNYLLTPATADHELIFCYNAKEKDTFEMTKAAVINSSGTPERTGNFCDATKFSSGRKAVITQVHMRKNTADDTLPQGRNLTTNTPTIENNINLSLSAISIMPAFSSEDGLTAMSTTKINDCLKKSAFHQTIGSTGNSPIAQCFADLGVPHTVHNIDYQSGNAINLQR